MELSRNRVVLFDEVAFGFCWQYRIKKIGIYFPEYEQGMTAETVDRETLPPLPYEFTPEFGEQRISKIRVREKLDVYVLGSVEETVNHINKSLRE